MTSQTDIAGTAVTPGAFDPGQCNRHILRKLWRQGDPSGIGLAALDRD
jgi:hypothetical protein